MKRMAMTIIALTALMTPALALAADEGSVARGKELFNSTRLGTNKKSCATCHPNGENLGETGSINDKELVKIVNACIQGRLAGKPLPADSVDMASIIMYLRTFSPPLK